MTDNAIHVTAVDRAMDVLELVGASVNPVSIQEMSHQLAIPGSSCFRIVKNLVAREYLLESYQSPGRYELGFKILHLAEQATHKMDIRSTAITYMRKLAHLTNHAVQLGVLEGEKVVYVEQVLPMRPVNIIASLHQPLPVNISAAGKVLCAYLPLYQRIPLVTKCVFEQRTENSIVDKEQFLEHLELVRQVGFAQDEEEYSRGIGCLAMPIFDYRGQCIATLGITGDIADYRNVQKFQEMELALRSACREISRRLGYKE